MIAVHVAGFRSVYTSWCRIRFDRYECAALQDTTPACDGPRDRARLFTRAHAGRPFPVFPRRLPAVQQDRVTRAGAVDVHHELIGSDLPFFFFFERFTFEQT